MTTAALSGSRLGVRSLVMLLSVVLLSGCASGDSGSSGGSGGDSPAPGDPLTAGQLSTVLLTPDELPDGYLLDPSPDEDDSDQDFGTSECATKLEEFAGNEDETPAGAEVSRTFTTGEDDIAGLEQTVESYDDEDALEASIDEFRSIIADCGQLTFSADGVPATLTVSEADVPEHGDDTLGFRMKGQISAFPFELVFGINRLGHNVHLVMVGGLGEADTAALTSAMDLGYAKLEKAHKADPNTTVTTAPQADAETEPAINTGGPGTYTGQTETGVSVELVLPADPVGDPLSGRVRDYLDQVGGEFADLQLLQVSVTNSSDAEVFLGGVTVVTTDGEQLELDNLVLVLNETSDVNSDAYNSTGGDLNDELSDMQLSDLKPGARGSELYALPVPAEEVADVYVNVDGEDVQLGLA